MQKTQKIGASKGSRRLCLWNLELNNIGLSSGTPVEVKKTRKGLQLVPCGESRRRVSRVLNHGKELPVIDLKETKSLSLACLGEIGDKVLVSYSSSGVTLQPSK